MGPFEGFIGQEDTRVHDEASKETRNTIVEPPLRGGRESP